MDSNCMIFGIQGNLLFMKDFNNNSHADLWYPREFNSHHDLWYPRDFNSYDDI